MPLASALLYLVLEKGMTVAEVSDCLNFDSGSLGGSRISEDMRIPLGRDRSLGMQAFASFVYHNKCELGSIGSALRGIDALVFAAAAIGEHASEIRRLVCDGMAWLGLDLDLRANAGGGPQITTLGTPTSAWVIQTDQDLTLARHTWTVLTPRAATAERTSCTHDSAGRTDRAAGRLT